MLTLYGIPNCDSCRNARKWLDGNNIEYRFHDVRTDGVKSSDVKRWLKSVAWEKLLNTRSTTWRNLPDSRRLQLDEGKVIRLLLEHPTLIKRPVTESPDIVLVGFSADLFAENLS